MALPWYAHDIEAYSRKTRALTMEQDGAYRRLLDHYYDTEGPLPASLPEVFRVARCSSKVEQKSVIHVLNAFFTLAGDGWHNERADEEIEKRRDITANRSKAGANGAANRKQKDSKRSSKPEALADTLNTEQDLETNVSKSKRDAPFVLPDWVPLTAWDEFLKVRKQAKSNPTEYAKSKLVYKLKKLKEQGFSPQECIDAAIESGWKTFYPPPSQRHANGTTNRPNPHATFLAAGLAVLDDKFKAA